MTDAALTRHRHCFAQGVQAACCRRTSVMRATRFALKLPVRYRPVVDARWLEGLTENISRSGVLFRAEELVDLDTPIEFRVELPADAADGAQSEVLCSGRIVRSVGPRDLDTRPALAATIADYHFVRQALALQ